MAQDKNVVNYLAVGTVAMIHTRVVAKGSTRYRTVIRGWRKPTHILLDRPKTSNDRYVALEVGKPCVVRYLAEGTACAFGCNVEGWDKHRHNPYLRVSWPQAMERVAFRKFERVKVELPCTLVAGEDEISGVLCDLSLGGFGLTCAREVEKDSTISVSLALPGVTKLQDVQAIVRVSRATGESVFVGCEFSPGQVHVENDIAAYVSIVLRSSGKVQDREGGPILVVEDDEKMSQRLKRNLERHDRKSVLTNNTIDAAHRLRTTSLDAILLSATLRDLPGADLCRIIKANKDFAKLPVFVYGGEAPDIEEKAKNAGATGYFPPSASLAPDVAGALAKALQGDHPCE